jgi:hypothetical protein
MNSLFRRSAQPPPTPAIVIARNKLIEGGVMMLLAVIAGGVTYIAVTVPMKLQSLDASDQHTEKRFESQDRINERVIGILERHEQRDDEHGERLTKLEHKQ